MPKFNVKYAIVLHLLFALNVQAQNVFIKPEVPLASQVIAKNTTYIIQSVVDMNGASINVPYNTRIVFNGEGKLINGVLIGNESGLAGNNTQYIGVKCEGTWKMPVISDEMFDRDVLSDNQIFKNIEILQSENIENEINLSSQEYNIYIEEKNGCGLQLKSHTILNNNSTIRLIPNYLSYYSIIGIANVQDVTINGGMIIGDLEHHKFIMDNLSQWGHGINISVSKNVLIKNVRISKCIGDGIAITGRKEELLGEYFNASKDVKIINSVMDCNRRQGMSIIHADNVIVESCTFSNTGSLLATSPAAGLDIEPNANDRYKQGVRNIKILNCKVFGNKGGGIKVQGYAVVSGICSISGVTIEKCEVDGSVDVAASDVVVRNCHMKSSTIRGTKDVIAKVEFEDCTWENGHGVQIYYSGYKNFDGNREGGIIDSLIITRGKILIEENLSDSYYKGAVAYHGGVGCVNHLLCIDSEIRIPVSAGVKFNLTKSNNIPDMKFINCFVSMPDRCLFTRGAKFENCTIDCKLIDMKKTDPLFYNHYIACNFLIKNNIKCQF